MMSEIYSSMTLRDAQLLRNSCYINGEWIKPIGTGIQVIHNPANGKAVGSVPVCGEIETRMAIDAAHAALNGCESITASERALLMRRWFDLILANLDDLALILQPASKARH